MSTQPFYVLLVALVSSPADVRDWRVESGWDSCLLMEQMLRRYAGEPLITRCLSSQEWEASGSRGAAAMPVAQQASPSTTRQISAQDSKFLQDLARSDMAEIAAGKLALGRTQTASVRDYAKLMVDSHGKLLSENENVAKLKGVETPAGLDRKHQAAFKRLEDAPDERFDSAYLDHAVARHREAEELARRAAAEARDPNLKALAVKVATYAAKHLDIARQLATAVGRPPARAGAQRLLRAPLP